MMNWWRWAGATRSCSISRPPRIAEAIARRTALSGRADLDTYRLVNGAADGAPGLAVDRYGEVAVIHADAQSPVEVERDLPALCQTGYVKIHPSSVARLSEDQRRQLAPEEPAWGPPRREITVVEL